MVGPLHWQAVDVEQVQRSVGGRKTATQDFTLVLRETHGVGVTFHQIKFEVYKPGYEAAGGELTNRLELAAYCELHLAFSSAGAIDPLWTITLMGDDERGQPVKFTIELAMPTVSLQATVPVDSAPEGLLTTLTLEERRRLQIAATRVTMQNFENLFSSREQRNVLLLPGATTVFDARVPQRVRRDLRNIAAALVPGTITSNSSLTLELDLSPYGGARGAFRFTHIARDSKPGRCAREILIESRYPGSDAAQDAPSPDEIVARHGFRIGPGWSEGERQALAIVLARIPDHLLAQIEGLNFNRGRAHPTEPERSGEYNSDPHSVTIFDSAFTLSMTRIGAPGSSEAVHAIAHEIGHAFDFAPLRSATERERFAVAEFNRTFGRYETSPGSGQYLFPKNQQASWDMQSQKLAALRQAREAVRTLSGSRSQLRPDSREFEFVDADGGDESVGEFRHAAGMDGPVRVTKYSERDWQEYFAECFSLYILDPQSLELLRSNIFQYFSKRFPR